MKNKMMTVFIAVLLVSIAMISGCGGKKAPVQDTGIEIETPPVQTPPTQTPPVQPPAEAPPGGLVPEDFDFIQPADEDNSLDDAPTVQ